MIRNPLYFFLRPVTTVRGYSLANLRSDVVAGLTVTMIVLPQAIAYALIAGLPPQYGLYAAIVASIFGALWSSSKQLQIGPTNTSSLLTLSTLALIATPGTPSYLVAAGMLTVMVGVAQLAMGMARLGALVKFVSDSVIVGFTAGAGILILANQIRNFLRLDLPSTAELLVTLQDVWAHLGESHLPSLAIGSGTIVAIVVLRRLEPRLPSTMIVMVGASVLVALLGAPVRTVGELPRTLPPFRELPLLDIDLIGRLSTGALSTAAIGVVEVLSIARVMASRTGQRLDSNQEFVGLGLANIACGFFSGYTSSGSFTRSAVNLQAGGQTQLAAVFTGLFVLVAALLLAPLAAFIPLAALAGVLMLTAYSLIDLREMDRIWRTHPRDRYIMLVTFAATLLLPLHFAILSGVLMSLGAHILRTSMPRVRFLVPDEAFTHFEAQGDRTSCPQLGVVEILGDLYFGAVQHIEEKIMENLERNPQQRYLLMRMHAVDNCDFSGVHALEAVLRTYRSRGGDVYMVRVRRPVLDVFRTSGFLRQLGEDKILPSDEAVSHLFYNQLDPAICIYECPQRVFQECQNLPKQTEPLAESCPAEYGAGSVPTVEPTTLWKELQTSTAPLVIDVREPREFEQGHVPGAQVMPLPGLLRDSAVVPHDKPVVLVCRTSRRSTRAACVLRQRGFERVSIMKGGMVAWRAANLLEAVGEDGLASAS
ncbi:MAG: sulfate permease [Chloroflexota bacterium]